MSSTFGAAVFASNMEDALRRVAETCTKHGLTGFAPTGRATCTSERHLRWVVEIANEGGDVDDAWVVLTSYGISPDETLGSVWETVPGVGA